MGTLRFCLALVLALAVPAAAGAGEVLPQDRLLIVTASGTHEFSVEVMRSSAELEKGLMFRRRMAPDAGMLFDFGEPQNVSMWMKNTYLPLDMLFIGKNGRVVSVAEHAVPMSETVISSAGPITGVLEINAGTVARIGVKLGDRVRHPMFGS